jgi:cytochrome c556
MWGVEPWHHRKVWVVDRWKAAHGRAVRVVRREGEVVKRIIVLLLLGFASDPCVAQTTDQRRTVRPRRPPVKMRAEPPAQWDKSVEVMFAKDAFSLLGDKQAPVAPPPAPAPPKPPPLPPFDRSAVMKELAEAEEALVVALADENRFRAQRKDFDTSVKVLLDNAESIVANDSEYQEDDTYMELAKRLHATVEAIPATLKADGFGGMGVAVGKLKKVCNDCHDKYR